MIKSNRKSINNNINNNLNINFNNNNISKVNKEENEIKEKKQTNIIYIQQDKHINKFQRSNHKYHEIKSTSSDRIAKMKDNENGNEDNRELFRAKINKKPNLILNSTSMDNIRGRRKKYNEGEIKINNI